MDGGEAWASRGVIFVSVTYRLGVIGFFSHPLLSAESSHRVSGNYGLFDQIAALKWIQNNIRQFGGDPGNITIFGQSAGAGSVQSLCASPLSRNLISNAISMSGGGLNTSRPVTLLDTAQLNNKMIMDYYKKTTLAEMRALSFEELVKMSSEYTAATNKRVSWSPVVDGYLLTGTFSNVALAGEIADIPYMFGYTANDMNDATQAVKDFCALRAKQSSKPAFAYLFARPLPGDDNGAWHSSDLWYVFNSFSHSWRPFTEGDKELSQKIVDYWTNFTKFGNPNGKDGGLWTPYTAETPKFMVFNVDGDKTACTMTDTPEFKGPSPRK
jgi:para-nitrobenzyl esterase